MTPNLQSHIPIYLRQNRELSGLINSLLEYPLLEFQASEESDCLNDEQVESFYEKISLFINGIGESPPTPQEIDQMKLYQRELGERILKCDIPHKIRDAIQQIQEYHARNRFVSLKIISNDHYLESIPWELAGDPHVTDSAGLAHVSVTRFIDIGQNYEDDLLADPGALSLMLVSAQPIDKNSPNPDDEFKEVTRQIEKRKAFPVEIFPYPHSEYLEFIDNLQANNPTVLHIALHGTRDGIYFQHHDSHQLIPYTSLLDDIKQTSNLLLVVLNVCYSAYSAENVKSPSFARALVEMGIPAVVGMATQFTPRASVEFSKRLYGELSYGHPAIQGFDRAVDTLRNHPKYDSLLWSVPMYYHNSNVIPFPTVWENNARLKQKQKINVELIRRMRKLTQESSTVLQDLQPYSDWRLEQWDIETIPLRFLLQQLKSGVNELENMRTTHDAETMEWIFSIRDKAHETSSILFDLELNLDRLLDDSLSQRERRDGSEEFDQARLLLIQTLSDLFDVLR